MKITMDPATRFGWKGTTLEYVVKADGASEIRVPADQVDGLKIRVTDTERVGDALQAKVEVEVGNAANECHEIRVDARDAAGTTESVQLALMTAPPALVPAVPVVGILTVAATVLAIRWGGWGGWTLGIVSALVTLAIAGTYGIALYTRYAGLPWGIGS